MLANKEKIDKKTKLIPITVGTYQKILNLDIIETSIYDVIFGLLWLKKYNPRISYKKRVIKFKNCECQSTTEIQEISLKIMVIFYKKDLNSVILIMVFIKKGFNEFKLLFKKYRRFKLLFQEKLRKKALLKY
jgi:hypothetical protein